MRLLTSGDDGNLCLTENLADDDVPEYAILSHTWGPDSDEISFEDLCEGNFQSKPGYRKMQFCAGQTSRDGLAYLWIDTCCIKKSNDAELTESINSMYRWYEDAAKCYVYLADVDHDATWEDSFRKSRWFSRGWTLQELIAPKQVLFFSRDGTYLGDKSSLESVLAEITGISPKVLQGHSVSECTVEERMLWAEGRRTKREEDQIYSLLGIFDVSMPVIYGEGREKARRRLLFEIQKNCKPNLESHRGLVPCHLVSVCTANNIAIHDSRVSGILGCEQPSTEQLIVQLSHALQELQSQMATLNPHQINSSPTISAIAPIPEAIHHRAKSHPVVYRPGETSTSHVTSDKKLALLCAILKLSQTLSNILSPFGFETWPSFRPEEYALRRDGPPVICYSFNLDKEQTDTALMIHDLFVAKNHRNWIRLRLKLTVHVRSAYWKVVAALTSNTLSGRPRWIGYRPIPASLISLVMKLLNAYPEEISDDKELNVYLDKGSQTKSTCYNNRALRTIRSIDLETVNECHQFTESLRHYSTLRIVAEEELVSTYLSGTHMIANLDNRWVAYRIATTGQMGFRMLRRAVSAGLDLRGEPHISQMLGVVMDQNKTLLKGMLMELPSKGPMFALLSVHKSTSNPVPWPVRQKWAKQTVQGVAAFHSKHQVIGGLRTYSWCVCIDEHDNAVVMNFPPGSHPSVHRDFGLLPPEYNTKAFQHSDGHVKPEFDIFQLGLLLWHLYRDSEIANRKVFCSLDNCPNEELDSCIQHDHLITLPKAGSDIPQYLNKIITLCRQKDPRQRPPAWKLVHMFPTDQEIARELVMAGDIKIGAIKDADRLSGLETIRKLYRPCVICNICSNRCHDFEYFCEICDAGNYDLCQECFSKGEHCRDRTHFFFKVEFQESRDKALDKKIGYSAPDKHGKRAMAIF